METLASIVIAFAIGGVVIVGASITGQQEKLCTALGGKFTPAAPPADVCPGGEWRNLFRDVKPGKNA
jgi:hypothetical protein